MSIRVVGNVQQFSHYNFTATTVAADIFSHIPVRTNTIIIDNTDATNSILISFDAGTNWKTIAAGSNIQLECDNYCNRHTSLQIKSSASTVAVECLFGSEV
jgi:hypothetical protein